MNNEHELDSDLEQELEAIDYQYDDLEEEEYDDFDHYVNKWDEEVDDISGNIVVTEERDDDDNVMITATKTEIIKVINSEEVSSVDPEDFEDLQNEIDNGVNCYLSRQTSIVSSDGTSSFEEVLLPIHNANDTTLTLSENESIENLELDNTPREILRGELNSSKSEVIQKSKDLLREIQEADDTLAELEQYVYDNDDMESDDEDRE